MDSKLLSHLLQLAARTGDRLIVVDPTTQQPFVLMGLPQYEALLASRPVSPSPTAVLSTPIAAGAEAASVEETFTNLPTEVAEAIGSAMGSVRGFTPEPMHTVPSNSEEDRFYVEPLE